MRRKDARHDAPFRPGPQARPRRFLSVGAFRTGQGARFSGTLPRWTNPRRRSPSPRRSPNSPALARCASRLSNASTSTPSATSSRTTRAVTRTAATSRTSPAAADDKPVCVCGIVVSTKTTRLRGKSQMFEATLQEVDRHALSSLLTIRWFNTWYVQKIFAHGQRVVIYGKPKASGKRIFIDHPEFEIIENDADGENLIHLQRIAPVHATTEGLSQRSLRTLIFRTLQMVDLDAEPTPLPDGLDPMPRGAALRAIHFPEDDAQRENARRHLVLSEFFACKCSSLPGAPGPFRAPASPIAAPASYWNVSTIRCRSG